MGSNLETYQHAHLAFNERDWSAVTAAFTEGTTYTDHSRGITVTGPEQFVEYLKNGWLSSFSDGRVSEPHYQAGTGHVICEFLATGTNDGPLGSFAATGKTISAPLCEIMRFDTGGRIVSGGLYYDQMTLLVQLGHAAVPTTAA